MEEMKRTISIALPVSLYQRLLREAGKGKVGTFIKKVVEEKFAEEEEDLGKAYREAYQNPSLLTEAKLWEKAQNAD
jgi:predicted DNA-binding protein